MGQETPSRNIGLDLLRVTEAAAVAAGRWIGLGQREKAHTSATQAMADALMELEVDGRIVIGEEGRLGEHSPLDSGKIVGTGYGPRTATPSTGPFSLPPMVTPSLGRSLAKNSNLCW